MKREAPKVKPQFMRAIKKALVCYERERKNIKPKRTEKEYKMTKTRQKPITSVQQKLLELARQQLYCDDPAVQDWHSLVKMARHATFRLDEPHWYQDVPDKMAEQWRLFPDEGKVMVLIVGLCAEDKLA